ncbi:MAG: aldo/keto reductase [Prolixibacteraceae bacterium]|nr:aldo/keto reductase [Prolixibacteraceae bacterium]
MKLNMNRRRFLGALSLGTAHVLFSNPLYAVASQLTSANPLQMVKLGNSGLETTLIGFGTGVNATNRSSALTRGDQKESLAMLRYAYDRGMRMFDSADAYGTHQLMGEAMKSMEREELMLTTKMWVQRGGIPDQERPDADVVVDRFRKELNTDYIDLVQIHLMTSQTWTDDWKKQMDILSDLKAKGIIKAHGVSVHSLDAMKTALASPWVDVIHVRINPYGIAMDKPEPEEVVDVISKLHASGKGVIGMKLIGAGRYGSDSERIDNSIKFVTGLGSVDMMVIGFERQEQIDNYLARVENILTNRG